MATNDKRCDKDKEVKEGGEMRGLMVGLETRLVLSPRYVFNNFFFCSRTNDYLQVHTMNDVVDKWMAVISAMTNGVPVARWPDDDSEEPDDNVGRRRKWWRRLIVWVDSFWNIVLYAITSKSHNTRVQLMSHNTSRLDYIDYVSLWQSQRKLIGPTVTYLVLCDFGVTYGTYCAQFGLCSSCVT